MGPGSSCPLAEKAPLSRARVDRSQADLVQTVSLFCFLSRGGGRKEVVI